MTKEPRRHDGDHQKERHPMRTGSDDYGDQRSEVHEKVMRLWMDLQGPLHRYIKELAPLVERCLVDERFRERLLAEPERVFQEEGINFGKGLSVKVVEDAVDDVHLVLPPRVESIPPDRIDLLDSALKARRGASGQYGQDDWDTATKDRYSDKGGKDDWHPFFKASP